MSHDERDWERHAHTPGGSAHDDGSPMVALAIVLCITLTLFAQIPWATLWDRDETLYARAASLLVVNPMTRSLGQAAATRR